jgi:hypothetical protein
MAKLTLPSKSTTNPAKNPATVAGSAESTAKTAPAGAGVFQGTDEYSRPLAAVKPRE